MTDQTEPHFTPGDPYRGVTDKEPALAGFFRSAMKGDDPPDYLGYQDHGWYEFAVDVLNRLPASAGVSVRRRELYASVCKQLVFQTEALDGYLAETDTGRLIRVVLHAEQGVLHCDFVVERCYVVAIVFGGLTTHPLPVQPRVEGPDRTVSGLATRLREDLKVKGLNPGGWNERMTTVPGLEPSTGVPASAKLHERGVTEVAARLAGELDPYGLCYLARYRAGEIIGSADLLDHPIPKKVWGSHADTKVVRARYDRITEEFGGHCAQLSQLTRTAVRGRLVRIVLDVERGAIYYYRLGAGDYLVGVTVNQEQVALCDERVGRLVTHLLAPATD